MLKDDKGTKAGYPPHVLNQKYLTECVIKKLYGPVKQ